MWVLLLISLASVILGILIILRRKDLAKLENYLNTTVTKPLTALNRHPLTLGVFLIVFSIFLLFIAKSIVR